MDQRMNKKYCFRRVLHLLAVYSCISLTLASSQDPSSLDMRSSKTTSRRTDASVDLCKENLLEATREHGFKFTQDAYLDFIEKQSNGAIAMKTFDASILNLAHEYWAFSCTVGNGQCTGELVVSTQEILDFKRPNGSEIFSDFCARIDGILQEIVEVTPVPTTKQSSTPSKSPTKLPTLATPVPGTPRPSPLPSPAPTKSPTKFPTLAPAPLSSTPPTLHPSPNPTLELFDLSQCDYDNQWRFDQITEGKCASAQGLIAEGRINCNSECPDDGCAICKLCLDQNLNCAVPTVSPSPTSSPTNRDQFTLTFSIGYDNDIDAKAVVEAWATTVVFEELEKSNPDCTLNTQNLCPIATNVDASLILRNCNLFSPTIEAEKCALADLSVAISSTDAFVGLIINEIETKIRDRIGNELDDLLSVEGFNALQ